MTVAELIAQLNQLPPEMEIYAAHFCYDSTELLEIKQDTIVILDRTFDSTKAVIDPLDLMNVYETVEAYLAYDS